MCTYRLIGSDFCGLGSCTGLVHNALNSILPKISHSRSSSITNLERTIASRLTCAPLVNLKRADFALDVKVSAGPGKLLCLIELINHRHRRYSSIRPKTTQNIDGHSIPGRIVQPTSFLPRGSAPATPPILQSARRRLPKEAKRLKSKTPNFAKRAASWDPPKRATPPLRLLPDLQPLPEITVDMDKRDLTLLQVRRRQTPVSNMAPG